jgi:protein SCO1/2
MKMTTFRSWQVVLIFLLVLPGMATTARSDETRYQSTLETYQMPDVTLITQEGKRVRFKDVLMSDKPVIVDFIFCTCSTICPVLSASFINLQGRLGADSQSVHLVSISIDPENDTPRVMKEYLKRYRGKPGWDFLTGSLKDIVRVRRAFNSYVENKMSHQPLMFIRRPKDGVWIRLFGILSTEELMTELKKAGT